MIFVFFAGALLAHCANAASLDKTLLSSGRIYGGEDALIETYPYMVSLLREGDHNCGGSIISGHYVLTAAHCLDRDLPLALYAIRSGSSFRNEGGVIHPIAEVIYTDDYNPGNMLRRDIAIVRVARPFEFDDTRRPIQLFDAGEVLKDGTMGVVTGWGYTEYGLPHQLQVVKVPTISKELCNKAYAGDLEGQVCAGYYGVGGKDSCQADSGGPFAVEGRLAGVVSYGNGCALPDYPGVYVEVAFYRDWIKKHTGV